MGFLKVSKIYLDYSTVFQTNMVISPWLAVVSNNFLFTRSALLQVRDLLNWTNSISSSVFGRSSYILMLSWYCYWCYVSVYHRRHRNGHLSAEGKGRQTLNDLHLFLKRPPRQLKSYLSSSDEIIHHYFSLFHLGSLYKVSTERSLRRQSRQLRKPFTR